MGLVHHEEDHLGPALKITKKLPVYQRIDVTVGLYPPKELTLDIKLFPQINLH